jgi:hypothetical protein
MLARTSFTRAVALARVSAAGLRISRYSTEGTPLYQL